MPAESVARYRMEVFRGPRGGLRLATSDPRLMADEYEALSRVAPRSWHIEMRDMHEGREGSLIGYEELRRRQNRRRYGNYLSPVDRRAESGDRKLAKSIALWAYKPGIRRAPAARGGHDWRRVREHAYEYTRDEGVFGRELDHVLDRIDQAIRRLA